MELLFNIQPTLSDERILLLPLLPTDFEQLFEVANDVQIWEQHPNQDRWKKDVFYTFFLGAIASKGAFKVIDPTNGKIIGSTRFYDFDFENESIFIGYTFLATQFWGKGINHAVKRLMLDYIFKYVSKVYFHIGANNLRSQIAIVRLGATKMEERAVPYWGESPKLNHVYMISKEMWWRNRAAQ